VLVSAALAVLEVDGDELLDSARAEGQVGTGVYVVMTPVALDHVDACTRVPTAVADADDGVPLLKTFADGVGVTVPLILEVVDHVNTSVAAAHVTENDVPLLEAPADEKRKCPCNDVLLLEAVRMTCYCWRLLQMQTWKCSRLL